MLIHACESRETEEECLERFPLFFFSAFILAFISACDTWMTFFKADSNASYSAARRIFHMSLNWRNPYEYEPDRDELVIEIINSSERWDIGLSISLLSA